MKLSLASDEGFTLIESIVAVVILAIGILSIYAMVTATIKGNSSSNSMTIASIVLSEKIENLISLPYDHADLDADIANNPHTVMTGLPDGVNSLSWTVELWSNDNLDNDGDGRVDEYDERGVKKITVTVDYDTISGRKTQTLNFIKSEVFK
ncbi:type IV pilus modification PilV family protein [Desulfolithobacter sp.]